MRISDWSSDVCSSDLIILRDAGQAKEALPGILAEARSEGVDLILSWGTSVTLGIGGTLSQLDDPARNHEIPEIFMIVADPVGASIVESLEHRSEEHTSELQSLMRISYAVFCLKKKKITCNKYISKTQTTNRNKR